jgi:hypothetical protein
VIPVLMVLRIETPDHRPIRLWIPLILIWIVLAPFVILLAPFALLLALVVGLNPFVAAGALIALIAALSDTCVEVEAPDARVFLLVK